MSEATTTYRVTAAIRFATDESSAAIRPGTDAPQARAASAETGAGTVAARSPIRMGGVFEAAVCHGGARKT